MFATEGSGSPSVRSSRRTGRAEETTLLAPGSRSGEDSWSEADPWKGQTGKGKGSHASGDGGGGPKGPVRTYGPQRSAKESRHAFPGSGYPSFVEQPTYPHQTRPSDMGNPMNADPSLLGGVSNGGNGMGTSQDVFGNTSQQVPFVPHGFHGEFGLQFGGFLMTPMTPMKEERGEAVKELRGGKI